MSTRSIAILFSAFALAAISAPVFAEDNPTGLPNNPDTSENVIPGPAATNPTDPAAADSAKARVPTTENLGEVEKEHEKKKEHKESTKY